MIGLALTDASTSQIKDMSEGEVQAIRAPRDDAGQITPFQERNVHSHTKNKRKETQGDEEGC
jgi:hypothetical protein